MPPPRGSPPPRCPPRARRSRDSQARYAAHAASPPRRLRPARGRSCLRRHPRQRQREREPWTTATVLNLDRAPVRLDDTLADGEPQPAPASAAGPERIENAVQVHGSNRRALVLDPG